MDRTNSLGLWTCGEEFFDAARLIRNHKGEASNVAYYSVCHSLELTFKAYLRGKGYKLEDLKKNLGHDLEKILAVVERENIDKLIDISDEFRKAILMISEYYKNKEFEYIETGKKTFPHIDKLLKFAEQMLASTKTFCYDRMKYNEGKNRIST